MNNRTETGIKIGNLNAMLNDVNELLGCPTNRTYKALSGATIHCVGHLFIHEDAGCFEIMVITTIYGDYSPSHFSDQSPEDYDEMVSYVLGLQIGVEAAVSGEYDITGERS